MSWGRRAWPSGAAWRTWLSSPVKVVVSVFTGLDRGSVRKSSVGVNVFTSRCPTMRWRMTARRPHARPQAPRRFRQAGYTFGPPPATNRRRIRTAFHFLSSPREHVVSRCARAERGVGAGNVEHHLRFRPRAESRASARPGTYRVRGEPRPQLGRVRRERRRHTYDAADHARRAGALSALVSRRATHRLRHADHQRL